MNLGKPVKLVMPDYKLVRYQGQTLPKPWLNFDVVGDGLINQIVGEVREHAPGVYAEWVVRERIDGLWCPIIRKANRLTDYGLSALASAIGGGYSPPNFLVYDGNVGLLSSAYGAGVSSVSLATNPTLGGDTGLVLGVGTANQETVQFSSVSGTGPFTFTLSSPTTLNHAISDPCVRQTTHSDVLASITQEQQYDSVNAPGERLQATAGYSTGVGNFIMQFYFLSTQAVNQWFGNVGSSENNLVGHGNLHNIYSLGYFHTSANDVEIDVSITITNTGS